MTMPAPSEHDPDPDRIEQRKNIMANGIKPRLHDNQVAILLIVTNHPDGHSTTHYISNGQRQSVYVHLRDLIKKWDRDFQGGN